MATTERPPATTNSKFQTRDLETFACDWEIELSRAGVDAERGVALRYGVPLLALAMLAAAAIVALIAPDSGSNLAPLSLLLVMVSAVPWLRWIVQGDDGPTWSFVLATQLPIAALGIGQWFVEPLGLGSEVGYALLAFQPLLLAFLCITYASERLAIGASVIAYAAFTGPLLAAWIAGKDVNGLWVMTWQVIFALTAVAAHGVRSSHRAGIALTEAREALAWQAAAEERRRVARDVHDVVAHTLAVTMLHITAARMAVQRGDPAEAEEALEEAERHGRSSLADIRRIVRLLRSEANSSLDAAQPGLVDIEPLIESYRSAGLPIELSLAVSGEHLSPNAEFAIYRVLQEALTNAARYGSGPATVQLQVNEGEMSLNVGNPIDRHAAKRSQGSGLLGMRERIAAAGGTIEAGAEQGRWVVRAIIPNEAGA